MVVHKKIGLCLLFTFLIGVLGFGQIAFAEDTTGDTNANIPLVNLEVPIGSHTQVRGLGEYVSIFYQFAVSAVAIIAAVMIMYGGIVWLTAAGSSSRITESKERIIAAISGLIIAMMSYAILATINPQLVVLSSPTILVTATPNTISQTAASADDFSSSAADGSCPVAKSGTCEPTTLAAVSGGCFGTNVDEASSICYQESSGTSIESRSDVCTDGYAFSVGLFQVNMIANGSLITGCEPSKVFNYAGGSPGSNPDGGYNCSVKNLTLYTSCKAQFIDATKNVKAACSISRNGATWNPWSTNNICKF